MEKIEDLTARCIRCGFCLEACPTFTETGSEAESPRGRIYLVRSAQEGKLAWQEDVRPHIDRCLGCLACETACPSGVEYGKILELARDRLEEESPHKAKAGLLRNTTSPRLLRTSLRLGSLLPGRRVPSFLSRLLSGEEPEADRPKSQRRSAWPALNEAELPTVRGEVYLLEGCAMRVLYPRVHEATRRLLRRVGYTVRETKQGCCGSLHAHNGYLDEARERAERLIGAMPDDLPVIVNSAGCGSTMKGYEALLSDAPEDKEEPSAGAGPLAEELVPEAPSPSTTRKGREPGAFAAQVFDPTEFLWAQGLAEALAQAPGVQAKVTYHDACHLAHGQNVRLEPRELLALVPGLELIPLPESDTCCGSAGIYNLTQPKMARDLLERKWRNVESTGAGIVAMGNPGCHAWIGQAAREHGDQVRVLHTMELLEAAFSGLPRE